MQLTHAAPGLLEFRLLGPLEAYGQGTPLLLGGPKEQAVLALLVLRARSVVSAEALVAAVWDDDPPASAAKNVQTYVSQIRRQLRAAGAAETLVTRGTGYELRVAAEDVDVSRFERLLEEARAASARREPAQALELLQDALGLWRGHALSGPASSAVLAAEAARLEELRLLAVEERCAVELLLGRHAHLPARLTALVAEHPLRERMWAQLVLALYRCGRQADALQAYQRARALLVSELGLEPGPELRTLEAHVLAHDPCLAAPEPVAVPTSRAEALPAELAQPPSPLVGRAELLREAASAWEEARGGRTSILLLAGEPGIGKTRLAGALAAQALREGALVLYGRCDPEALIPFQPLTEALGRYAESAPLPLLRQHVLDTSGQLRRLLPELTRRLPDVMAALPPPSDDRHLLFDAVTGLVTTAARREPVVLVLDDLHWADAATLLLVRHVARSEGVALLVLATYRDSEVGRGHPLAENLALLRRSPSVRRLRLTGLDADAVAVLTREVLPRRGMATEDLAAQVQAQTDGNPLFVLEVLRHLRELGSAAVDEHGPAIPEGVREVIGQRVARLSAGADSLLTVGAVAGREFDLRVVAAAAEIDEEASVAAADEAVAAQLLREVPGQVDRFVFSHALVRAALYDELSASRRVRLHRRLATALEQAEAREPGRHLAELAHHVLEAAQRADVDRALHFARRAAEQAVQHLAYEDAARLYRGALEALALSDTQEPVRRAELLLDLGAAVAKADLGEARDLWLEAADLARQAGAVQLLARAAIAVVGPQVGAGFEGPELALLQEAEAALSPGDPLLPDVLQARALWLSSTPTDRGELERLSRRSLELARTLGDARALARATTTRLLLLAMPDEAEERLALADDLLSQAETLADDELAAAAHRHRGWALLETGQYRASAAAYEVHRSLAIRTRQPLALVAQAAIDVMGAVLDGRDDDAESLLDQLERAAQRFPQTSSVREVPLVSRVALRWSQGRLGELEQHASSRAQALPRLVVLRALHAHAAAEAGHLDTARTALAATAPDGVAALPRHLFWTSTLFHLAEATCLLHDAPRAQQLYDLLRPHAGRDLSQQGRTFFGSASYHLGRLAATAGRGEEARRHLADAVARHTALGSPRLVRLAEVALGQVQQV